MESGNLALCQQPQRGADLALSQRWKATFSRWLRRARERHELAQLDALTQRDLGLSDADVWREINKSPWRA